MFPPFEYADQLPATIEPDCRKTFRVAMCAEPENTCKVVVQVVLQRPPGGPQLALSFNGSWPRIDAEETSELLFPCGPFLRHSDENVAFNFRFDARRIRDGENEMVIFNGAEGALKIRIIEIATMHRSGYFSR